MTTNGDKLAVTLNWEEEKAKAIAWIIEGSKKAFVAKAIDERAIRNVLHNNNLTVKFSGRMVDTVGLAFNGYPKKSPRKLARWIKLSKFAWEHFSEKDKKETVLHELAHIFVSEMVRAGKLKEEGTRRRRVVHGKNFKNMCAALGDASFSFARHDFGLPPHPTRHKNHKPSFCGCPERMQPRFHLSPNQQKKLKSGNKLYCRSCKHYIGLTKEDVAPMPVRRRKRTVTAHTSTRFPRDGEPLITFIDV